MITRWILPVGFFVLGILILMGVLLRELPEGTGLRTLMGIVVVLIGLHRFVASRMTKVERRRYGGSQARPWEGQK